MTCTLEFADSIFANPGFPASFFMHIRACVLENQCGRIIQENNFRKSRHIPRNSQNLLSAKKTGPTVLYNCLLRSI